MSSLSPTLAVCLVALVFAIVACPAVGAERVVRPLADFGESDEAQVVTHGPCEVRAGSGPGFASAEERGPTGPALEITAGAGAAVELRAIPADWRAIDSIGMWVHRSAEEAARQPTTTVEIRIVEAGAEAWYWRKLELSHVGWAEVVLPLRWFRWSEGRTPAWAEVERLALFFRHPATVTVDRIYRVEGAPGAAALSLDDLEPVAFPGAGSEGIDRREEAQVRLLTDATALDLDTLAKHLAAVGERVHADLPGLSSTDAAPMMVVFADRDGFRRFHPRFGAMLHGELASPRGGGFTVQGIATSFWDERQGSLRPVYTHEYVHALLATEAKLPNRGEWFQEGVASYYQLQFHPQDNLARIVRDGIASPDGHLPLQRLCGGEPIPENRYWQAATVFEMLLTEEQYAGALARLLEAFATSRSTDLGPHLETMLGTDWEGFTEAWLASCERRFPMDHRDDETEIDSARGIPADH